MLLPDDASAYVAILIGDRRREAAAWWRSGSWWSRIPGEGKDTPHKSLKAAREDLIARVTERVG
jgi:hypothetical protein